MAKKLVGTLSISGMPLGEGGAADAVLYTPQELTTAQKAQARTNIGAVSAAEVDDAIEAIDLTPYATKVYVDEEIAAIHIPSLEGYATEQFVQDEIAKIPEVDLTGYATEQYVQEEIGKIPEVDLTGYAKETWVDEQLEPYALKTEIPDVSNFTTMAAVEEKGYQTEAQVNTLIDTALGVIENGSY